MNLPSRVVSPSFDSRSASASSASVVVVAFMGGILRATSRWGQRSPPIAPRGRATPMETEAPPWHGCCSVGAHAVVACLYRALLGVAGGGPTGHLGGAYPGRA